MLWIPRRLASNWAFLFQDIPGRAYRVFVVAYGFFCVLSLIAIADNTEPNRLDQTIANWIHERPILRATWCQKLTRLGDGDLVRKACALSVLALLLCRKWTYVSALLLGVLGEMFLCRELQDFIGRSRPTFPDVSRIGSFGFPSGHTGAAGAFYGFWALFVIVEHGNKRIGRVIALFLVGIALAVGVSRVFLLAHWATDVIGALAFSACWVLLCFWVNQRMYVGARSEPPTLAGRDSGHSSQSPAR